MRKLITSTFILLAGANVFANSLGSQVTNFVASTEKEHGSLKCDISGRKAEINTATASKKLRIIVVNSFNLDKVLDASLTCPAATKINFETGAFSGIFCRNSNTIFVNEVPSGINFSDPDRVIAHEYEHYLNWIKFKRLLGEHPLDLMSKIKQEAQASSKAGKWPRVLFRKMAHVQFLYLWDEARAFLKEFECTEINWAVSERDFVKSEIVSYIRMISGGVKIPDFAADFVYGLAIRYDEPTQLQNDVLFNSVIDSIVEHNRGMWEE